MSEDPTEERKPFLRFEEWGIPSAETKSALEELWRPNRVPKPGSVTAKDPSPSLPSATPPPAPPGRSSAAAGSAFQ